MPLGVIPTPHTVAASATSAVQSDQDHRRKSEAEDGHFAGPFHRDFIDTLIRQKLLPVDVHLFLLSDDETAAEKAKGEKLTAELSVAQKTIAEAEAKGVRLAEELSAVRKAKDDEAAKVRDFQSQLARAEREIKELQKSEKAKGSFLSLFGKKSTVDLAALEQAARRELFALKRPHGVSPPSFKGSQSDIIDV